MVQMEKDQFKYLTIYACTYTEIAKTLYLYSRFQHGHLKLWHSLGWVETPKDIVVETIVIFYLSLNLL